MKEYLMFRIPPVSVFKVIFSASVLGSLGMWLTGIRAWWLVALPAALFVGLYALEFLFAALCIAFNKLIPQEPPRARPKAATSRISIPAKTESSASTH